MSLASRRAIGPALTHSLSPRTSMYTSKDFLTKEIAAIREAGLYKSERVITSEQGAVIRLSDGSSVLNFCANNYLGLSSHPKVIEAAKMTLETHGYGMS